MRRKVITLDNDWPNICGDCGLRFPCKSALLLHRRWEHGEDALPKDGQTVRTGEQPGGSV